MPNPVVTFIVKFNISHSNLKVCIAEKTLTEIIVANFLNALINVFHCEIIISLFNATNAAVNPMLIVPANNPAA